MRKCKGPFARGDASSAQECVILPEFFVRFLAANFARRALARRRGLLGNLTCAEATEEVIISDTIREFEACI